MSMFMQRKSLACLLMYSVIKDEWRKASCLSYQEVSFIVRMNLFLKMKLRSFIRLGFLSFIFLVQSSRFNLDYPTYILDRI